jgi:hypothetical protein
MTAPELPKKFFSIHEIASVGFSNGFEKRGFLFLAELDGLLQVWHQDSYCNAVFQRLSLRIEDDLA